MVWEWWLSYMKRWSLLFYFVVSTTRHIQGTSIERTREENDGGQQVCFFVFRIIPNDQVIIMATPFVFRLRLGDCTNSTSTSPTLQTLFFVPHRLYHPKFPRRVCPMVEVSRGEANVGAGVT